jgi:hypothetical protein
LKNFNTTKMAEECYSHDLPGTDPRVQAEAERLLASIPVVKQLAEANLLSTSNPHNAVYAYRSRDQQQTLADQHGGLPTYPSGAFKFALSPTGGYKDSAFAADTCVAYHGSIFGPNVQPIAQEGLRGYASSDGTRLCNHTLVTPSWVIAMEMYGLEHTQGTNRFRAAFQVRVKHDGAIKKMADTAHSHQRDWIVPQNEVEWAIPVTNCAVTGIVVKQYHTTAAHEQLDIYDRGPLNGHRQFAGRGHHPLL